MPTLSIRREGNTGGCAIASTHWTCEVGDPRYVWNLHVREPGGPTSVRHEAVIVLRQVLHDHPTPHQRSCRDCGSSPFSTARSPIPPCSRTHSSMWASQHLRPRLALRASWTST